MRREKKELGEASIFYKTGDFFSVLWTELKTSGMLNQALYHRAMHFQSPTPMAVKFFTYLKSNLARFIKIIVFDSANPPVEIYPLKKSTQEAGAGRCRQLSVSSKSARDTWWKSVSKQNFFFKTTKTTRK